VTIFLDTFDEKRRAFAFIINPLGIQMDVIRTEEGGSDRMDESWDTVFFLGVDNDLIRDDYGRYGQSNYSVFLKFSYWWRM